MRVTLGLFALAAALAAPSLVSAQTAPHKFPLTDSQLAARGIAPAQPAVRPNILTSPIAYGYVTSSGVITAGSQNFTSTGYQSGFGYQITITGVSYFYAWHATTITASNNGVVCENESVNGTLLVQCFDHTGTNVPANFGFIVF